MTPEDVLSECAVVGIEVVLTPTGPVCRGGVPNQALLGLLKEHRDGIIELLGGQAQPPGPAPEPRVSRCPGHAATKGRWFDCGVWVHCPDDSEAFCRQSWCPIRASARQEEPW